jgi:hypothetical protein
MSLALEEVRAMLQAMVRTIDRKAELNTVTPHEGDRPGIDMTVTLRKHKIALMISQSDLEGAKQDSMRRSSLRTTIKRAIDRQTFAAPEIASTKMVRGQAVDGGFFRTQSGGFRGGRR